MLSNFAVSRAPVVVADFNGDGKPDLAVGGAVLLGNGDYTFRLGASLSAIGGTGQVAAADFNGDGRLDVAEVGGLGVSIFTGNGDGTFNSPVGFLAGSAPIFAAVGDFNGDGKPDLAIADQGRNCVTVLTNTTR
jgi:hypothetical protein